MADATQVQIRRDTASNLSSATPVEAELGYDQTNKRLVVGDGTTAGGIQHPNFNDARGLLYNRGTVGGSANAITLTLSPVPASYFTYMSLRFIASSTNTGATTINVNSLGTRDIYKVSGTNVIALVGSEIVSGGVYEITYDGTRFILLNIPSAAPTAIGQGNLATSTGTFSLFTTPPPSITISNVAVVAPGGEYGFSLNTLSQALFNVWGYPSFGTGGGYVMRYGLIYTQSGNNYASQRYVTSSPPYDMGDGEAAGFFFAIVDGGGNIKGHYMADAPPWAYNGPTNIRCSRICNHTGKKFRTVIKKRTFEDYMDGAPLEFKEDEITHKIKNSDMNLIPHPFSGIDNDCKVVMLDPMDMKIRKAIEYQNLGYAGEVVDELEKGKFIIDNDECKRCGPKGVKIHKLKYKYTSKF